MNKLKYTHYDIVFQEVPNETSLVFNISGCPHKCEGCHSQYLWENTGSYLINNYDQVINRYKELITCVCFMGGDQNIEELNRYLSRNKYLYEVKNCVYSGSNNLNIFQDSMQYLDYLKIGRYKKELGGLESKNTNQRFYRINNYELEDITYMFQKSDK